MGRTIPIKKLDDDKMEGSGHYIEHDVEILVAKGQKEIEEMDVLLHETIHAIDYFLDLELSERQVRLIATALIGVFQDSPEFIKFISRPIGAVHNRAAD